MRVNDDMIAQSLNMRYPLPMVQGRVKDILQQVKELVRESYSYAYKGALSDVEFETVKDHSVVIKKYCDEIIELIEVENEEDY